MAKLEKKEERMSDMKDGHWHYCKKAMGLGKLIAGLLLVAGVLGYLDGIAQAIGYPTTYGVSVLEWIFGIALVIIGIWKLSKKCGCEQCKERNW